MQAQVVASACHHVPISRAMVGPGGLVADPAAREAISQALQAILRRPVELPAACTLGPDDGAERMRRWHQLLGGATPIARRIGHQLEVRFQSGPGVRKELEALAAAEQQCCAFVTWTVSVDSGHPVLHVEASPDQPDNIEPIASLFDAPHQ